MRKVNLAFLIGAIVLFILAWATGHKEVHIWIPILWAITALIGQVELVGKDRMLKDCLELSEKLADEVDNVEKKIKSECVPVDVMCEWLDIYDVRVEGEKASDVIKRVHGEVRRENENA